MSPNDVANFRSPSEADPHITPENALMVIALELRKIRGVLETMAFDEDCATVLGQISATLHDNLQTFDGDPDAGSLAAEVRRLADALP